MKTFTLSEANSIIPKLKTMLIRANQELEHKANSLQEAYSSYTASESNMNSSNSYELSQLREKRAQFENSIEALSSAKNDYLQTLNFWLEEILDTGVILRDLKTGLLDFPARAEEFAYYLCWQLSENEISHWHTTDEGFIGRRPLAVLSEYIS